MTYDLLLFAHITAVIIWVGSGFFLQVLATMADRAQDDATFAGLLRYNGILGLKLFMPASMATLVLGVLLLIDGPWSADQLWIVIGIVGFAATFATGLLIFKPRGEQLAALIERDRGALGPEAHQLARELMTLARLDYVVLLVVIFDMAVKPTTDDAWALVVMALAVAGGVATILSRARQLSATTA